jgi:FtsZ-binding cell division protein ZapB
MGLGMGSIMLGSSLPGSAPGSGPPSTTSGALSFIQAHAEGSQRAAANMKLLQAHIDELTGEKLELMRGLSQQAKANEALAEENRALGEQLNALSGRAGAEEAVMKRMQVCLGGGRGRGKCGGCGPCGGPQGVGRSTKGVDYRCACDPLSCVDFERWAAEVLQAALEVWPACGQRVCVAHECASTCLPSSLFPAADVSIAVPCVLLRLVLLPALLRPTPLYLICVCVCAQTDRLTRSTCVYLCACVWLHAG